jgi:ankyrin repeat protein
MDNSKLLPMHSDEASRSSQMLGGYNFLHVAAMMGQEGLVQLLLDTGADPCAKDDSGHTALHLAVMQEHAAVASYLIDRMDVLSSKDDDGTRLCSTLLAGD